MKVKNIVGKETDFIHFSIIPMPSGLALDAKVYVVYGLTIQELPFMMNDDSDIDNCAHWEPIVSFDYLSSAVTYCNKLNSELLSNKGDNDG